MSVTSLQPPAADADDEMPELMDNELLDVYEYCFYVNVGNDFAQLMSAIAEVGSGPEPKYLVK